MQLFAGFEADSFAGRDAHLGAGTRIAPDAGFAGLDCEYAEAAKFDAIARDERLLHAVEDRVDGVLRLGPGKSGPIHDALDKVLFDHLGRLSFKQIFRQWAKSSKTARFVDVRNDVPDCQCAGRAVRFGISTETRKTHRLARLFETPPEPPQSLRGTRPTYGYQKRPLDSPAGTRTQDDRTLQREAGARRGDLLRTLLLRLRPAGVG